MADEKTSRDVIDAILFQDGEPEGIVQLPPHLVPKVTEALENAGIHIQQGQKTGDHEYAIDQQCEIENPRPCELSVALGRVQELGKEAGVDTGEIDQLESSGSATEDQAKAAVDAVMGRLNGDIRTEAGMWRDVTWGGLDTGEHHG